MGTVSSLANANIGSWVVSHPRRQLGSRCSVFPMEATIDSVGRIVLPKPLRDALGLLPGATVDVSFYGAGLQILPSGRTARIVDDDGALVADSDTAVTDDVVFGLVDSLRR